MNKEYWEKELETAMSKYNFDLMKEAVINGADPDDTILHRAINRDRVDVLEYFCFSPELSKHCNINYKFEIFGDDAPFVYACMAGAVKTVHFMLYDQRVSNIFNIEKNTHRGFYQACESYRLEMIDFLLNEEKTKHLCKIEDKDFKIIKRLDKETRWYKIEPFKEVLEYFIMNLDLNVVKEMQKHIVHNKDMFRSIFEARQLHEELIGNNVKNKSRSNKL